MPQGKLWQARIHQEEVLHSLDEGEDKTLREISLTLAGQLRLPLSCIPQHRVRVHLQALAKYPSLVDTNGKGNLQKWCFHLIK